VTTIPDYISPITGYRVWRWDRAGLRSLNGEPWRPGEPLEAGCRVSDFAGLRGRANATHSPHHVPQINCTCGIYASKSLEHLRECGYERSQIHGEVSLWGTVVEHQRGWRAQYAYPKVLFLAPSTLPFTVAAIQCLLNTLIPYGAALFVAAPIGNIPLWSGDLGYDAAGLDYLIETGQDYYVRSREERTLKVGDRVAILGYGTALVVRLNDVEAQAIAFKRRVLRFARKNVVWDQRNMRWELASVEGPRPKLIPGHATRA